MNAYELYTQDGGEGPRRTEGRRQYYLTLRQALLEEVRVSGERPLLAHLAALPGPLYLLDAAAVWEVFEQTAGRLRTWRDVGRGFPFPLDGQLRPWSEVQRRAETDALPSAVSDAAFRCRVTALAAGLRPGEKPPQAADPRATLSILPLPPMTKGQGAQDVSLAAELTALREENNLLRQVRGRERETAVQAAELLLKGETAQAQQLAAAIDVRLQAALAELAGVAEMVREKQAALDAALADLAQARQQLDALTGQARAAATDLHAAQAALAAAQAQRLEPEMAQDGFDDLADYL